MKWLKNVLREIFGLFVDDGAFALAILIWLGLMGWATPHLSISPAFTGLVLFAGLALILIESASRYARHKKSVQK
jgi:hypothetical protein